MYRGLPWAGGVSVRSVSDGSGISSGTRISSSLLDDLLELLISRGDELHQLVLYMHVMMMQ
jgi:D-alanyl-D-alanine carboxypeptidase